ncbi:cytochrome ubiquinol oxidase subunit I [Amycolatopsis taiwanensis]|uniref:Cytochrome ubiquinol oxidase subunit I n=1 Tax=Amycolatopsis taiwanensis TaxID=342230 RepID=A0A9W6R0Z4_9PSEU|nr:cytochrome ubiquinol oxidase subunit I [Amycolatopsis taiwanensis]GLY67154.1 cytochrome ubiquinol oxidase subunit I [Amycolatopsis taiwanensis]
MVTASLVTLAEGDIPARTQMGAALGFHIVFSCFGIAFPTIVLAAHWRGIRHGDAAALLLARRWSKVMAVTFAVGAVSGTVLSYELGLLWPGLMGTYGSAFGIPFAIEGIWFFLEAIFTAIYLYGWRRLSAWAHWWAGTPMVVAGALGALAVVSANSWMNVPSGFVLRDGRIVSVNAWSVIFNAATPYEVPHMVLAAYMVAGFVVAAVYAVGMLRGRRNHYHRLGFGIAFATGAIAAPIQVVVGDIAARAVAAQQPAKFAAMELIDRTGTNVTEWLGGIYYQGQVYFGVGIPGLGSLLAGSPRLIGWEDFPPELRAPLPNLIHLTFDGMVVIGLALMLLGAWQGWVWRFRHTTLTTRWFLIPAALSGIGAVVAMEFGWIVTEVGRQPWTVYGLLLTRDAVTTAGGVPVTLGATIAIYAVLTGICIGVPWLMSRRWRREDPRLEEYETTPYGPPVPEAGS